MSSLNQNFFPNATMNDVDLLRRYNDDLRRLVKIFTQRLEEITQCDDDFEVDIREFSSSHGFFTSDVGIDVNVDFVDDNPIYDTYDDEVEDEYISRDINFDVDVDFVHDNPIYDTYDDKVEEDKVEEEYVSKDIGLVLILQQTFLTPHAPDEIELLCNNLFQSICTIGGKVCNFINVAGSCENVILEDLGVQSLLQEFVDNFYESPPPDPPPLRILDSMTNLFCPGGNDIGRTVLPYRQKLDYLKHFDRFSSFGKKYQILMISQCFLGGNDVLNNIHSFAMSTRVSNELGVGRPYAAQLVVCVAVVMFLIEGAAVASVMILVRQEWGKCYSNEEKVVRYVSTMVPLIAASSLLDGVQCLLSGTIRGCGRQKIGAVANLGAYYLIGVPSAILFAFVFHIGGKGLWLGIMCGLFAQALSLLIITLRTNWDQEATKASERVFIARIPADLG